MNMDVYLNKRETILRCLARIREKYAGRPEHLDDLDRQEVILLNLQRACEAAIDLAMHTVAVRQAGVPQDSRDAFTLLEKRGVLSADLATRMRHMVGFRNIAVHQYRDLDREILRRIVEDRLDDFTAFLDAIRAAP